MKEKKPVMTNKEFAKTDKAFRKACDLVITKEGDELPNTQRQASKFRNGKGAAYKATMKASNKAVQP